MIDVSITIIDHINPDYPEWQQMGTTARIQRLYTFTDCLLHDQWLEGWMDEGKDG